MSDQYPRVQVRDSIRGVFLADGSVEYLPDPAGDYKVVPTDAIVIERGELPEVRRIHREIAVAGVYRTLEEEFYTLTAERAREVGLNLLALAEYLAAHPPVDEEQVQALAEVLAGHGFPSLPQHDAARRAIADGWTKPGVQR